jgi:hypothetical protein
MDKVNSHGAVSHRVVRNVIIIDKMDFYCLIRLDVVLQEVNSHGAVSHRFVRNVVIREKMDFHGFNGHGFVEHRFVRQGKEV